MHIVHAKRSLAFFSQVSRLMTMLCATESSQIELMVCFKNCSGSFLTFRKLSRIFKRHEPSANPSSEYFKFFQPSLRDEKKEIQLFFYKLKTENPKERFPDFA